MSNNGRRRVSLIDIQEWIEKLKANKIIEFEYGKLPKELQRRTFIQKAKDVGLIRSIGATNGRKKWRIVDGIKLKIKNGIISKIEEKSIKLPDNNSKSDVAQIKIYKK